MAPRQLPTQLSQQVNTSNEKSLEMIRATSVRRPDLARHHRLVISIEDSTSSIWLLIVNDGEYWLLMNYVLDTYWWSIHVNTDYEQYWLWTIGPTDRKNYSRKMVNTYWWSILIPGRKSQPAAELLAPSRRGTHGRRVPELLGPCPELRLRSGGLYDLPRGDSPDWLGKSLGKPRDNHQV